MIVTLIAAMSENHTIARDGDLPWSLPDDLKRFARVTRGHAVIMGRKTLDTLPGPLRDRRNIVLTRQDSWSSPGVEVASSLDEALSIAANTGDSPERVYVAGGAQVYEAAMPRADELDLTRVLATVDGDRFFPPIDESAWQLVSAEDHAADERHLHAFRFERWVRRPA